MQQNSFLKRRWKLIINIITVLALVVLVVALRDQLVDTFKNLFRVHAWVLLLIIPVEILNYDAQARQYRGLFRIVGNKLSYKQLMKATLEINFVNNVFPSGGAAGISYFGIRMSGEKITGAKATVVQLFKLVLLILSFEVLIVIALFALAIEGHMNSLVLLISAMLTTAMLLGTIAFAFIIGSKHRIAGFFTFGTRLINKLLTLFKRGNADTINIEKARELFEGLHDNYMLVRKDLGSLRSPFLWALMANVWEVLAVYVVYIAFGHWVNIGAVIIAYAVANFAGLVSVLPGGIGIYEGLMTLTLGATGVPSRISLPVTVMYRVLNTLVQLPPGYYFYQKAIKQASSPVKPNLDEHT